MTNIVITGGAGFIGKYLTESLSGDQENCIWVLDSLHPQVHGTNAAIPEFQANVTFVKGDLTDKGAVNRLIKEANPEIIFHLVSETGTGQSMDEISRYCEVNVQGTAYLLEAIKQFAPSLQRFVLPSSRAVYGEGSYIDKAGDTVYPGSRDESSMRKGDFSLYAQGSVLTPAATAESAVPKPISIYASTKLMQEYLVIQAGETAPWAAVALRLQNVYGAGQSLSNPYTGVLSIFSSILMAGGELNIYEDGDITRDFIYVTDVVRALILASQKDLPHGTVINIGSGETASILDVAKIMMGLHGVNKDKYHISGDFRAGDIRYALADIAKARTELQWVPEVDLQQGVRKLVEWSKAATN